MSKCGHCTGLKNRGSGFDSCTLHHYYEGKMKLYILNVETNPHIPSSGYQKTLFMSTDKKEIDKIYNEYPNYHYEIGQSSPALVLRKEVVELPFKYPHLETFLKK